MIEVETYCLWIGYIFLPAARVTILVYQFQGIVYHIDVCIGFILRNGHELCLVALMTILMTSVEGKTVLASRLKIESQQNSIAAVIG